MIAQASGLPVRSLRLREVSRLASAVAHAYREEYRPRSDPRRFEAVNALAFADELPVSSLVWAGVEQTRIPDQRGGHAAAIDEMNGELVICDDDIHRPRFRLNDRSTHSKPPELSHEPRQAGGLRYTTP
jgi:hypothetical protein